MRPTAPIDVHARLHALRGRLARLSAAPRVSAPARAPDLATALDELELEVERVAREVADMRALRERLENDLGELFEVITRFASQDAEARARVGDDQDAVVQGLARGLNRIGEELGRSMHRLVYARDQAVAAAQAKSAFVASMSHELRTPLNAILGYAEMLRDELVEARLPESVADMDRLLLASRELLQIIGDVLDLAKLDAGKLAVVLEEVVVEDLVGETCAEFAEAAAAVGTRLSTRCDLPTARAVLDGLRVRQVLRQLVRNAVKFTRGGEVEVRARVREVGGRARLQLEVRDTGIGVPSAARVRIFEPFAQAEQGPARRYGGAGLGLSIGRGLCALMGGTLELVESEPGVGSRFRAELPWAPAVNP